MADRGTGLALSKIVLEGCGCSSGEKVDLLLHFKFLFEIIVIFRHPGDDHQLTSPARCVQRPVHMLDVRATFNDKSYYHITV
jgi:hypothetical protein